MRGRKMQSVCVYACIKILRLNLPLINYVIMLLVCDLFYMKNMEAKILFYILQLTYITSKRSNVNI